MVPINLRDLWNYRDLLYILMMRDIKVRNKQMVLGIAWAVIQPLFTTIVFTIFFGGLASISFDGIPYPLFALADLLSWTFFSNVVTNSGNSLVGNANLITKVYFPRMVIPIASIAAGLLDLAISFYTARFDAGLLQNWLFRQLFDVASHCCADFTACSRSRNVDERT